MRSVRAIHEKSLSTRVAHVLLRHVRVWIQRRFRKRPPLEDIISAWAGARW